MNLRIIDPTAEKKWITLKAKKLGILLKHNTVEKDEKDPELIIGNYGTDNQGWTRSLNDMPHLSKKEIEEYFERMSKKYLKEATKIK